MAEPIYQEEIGASMAEMILQNEFIEGDNMRYFIISELYGTVVMQYNKNTGEQTETKLEEAYRKAVIDVPKIEKFKYSYKEGKPLGVTVQIALTVAVIAVVVMCFLWLARIGGG